MKKPTTSKLEIKSGK